MIRVKFHSVQGIKKASDANDTVSLPLLSFL